MQDLLEKIKNTLRSVWRYRWIMLLVAWFIGVGGWTFVFTLPDQYKAETVVVADTDSILRRVLGKMVVSGDYKHTVYKVKEHLLSRPNLDKIIRANDLHLEVENQEEMEALYKQLRKRIKIESRDSRNRYKFSFVDKNPKRAKKVVSEVLSLFIETTLKDNRKDADDAQIFLDEEIEAYRKKLEEKENELKEFKRTHIGQMPGNSGDYYTRFQKMSELLKSERLSLEEKKNSRDELKRHLREEKKAVLSNKSEVIDKEALELEAEIKKYEDNLQQLLLNYTDNHPDVIRTKEVIAQLKEKKEARKQDKSGKKENDISDLSKSLAYQEIKVLLGRTEAELAVIQTRVDEYEKRLADLKGQLDILPQVEAELKSILRDYNIHKANYEMLVSRKESAQISKNVEQKTDGVDFDVIEPPFVEAKPSGPKRPLFSTVVLIFALGAGGFFAFVMSQIRPVFDTSRTLSNVTGYPVLGSISMVTSRTYRIKRKLEILSFLLGVLIYFAGYALVIVLQYYRKDVIGYALRLVGLDT